MIYLGSLGKTAYLATHGLTANTPMVTSATGGFTI
jgi:hypothetical protein